MYRKKEYFYYMLFISLFFFTCKAYVYQLSALKKEDGMGFTQLIIGISDYHDKDHPLNKEQRDYLHSFLKKIDASRFKLIIEDLSSLNNEGKGMCCHYKIHASGGLLGNFADAVRNEHKEVDNVEYRFCRVAGIGPLLNNASMTPKQCISAASISIDMLCNEVFEQISSIACYNDVAYANALYKRIIQEVKTAFNYLKLDRVRRLSIADYCTRFSNQYKNMLEKLCIFDSPLIEAKILHSIVVCRKPMIIVAAGGSHIEKMNTYLQSMGYKNIYTTGISAHKVVESSLGFEKSKHTLYPKAIDMRLLDQFVPQ